MAKAKFNKKIGPVLELPECPVCLETMSAPIFQCQSGHSLCNTCTKHLIPPICPICRQAMTQMRNWQLEDLISKATVTCPNHEIGCTYKLNASEVENHIKECIFRVMSCPLGIFGKCSWTGTPKILNIINKKKEATSSISDLIIKGALKEMFSHFKERHPQSMLQNLNQEVSINNISVTEDDRFVYVVPQGNMIFILTLKIDINQKLAYWVVQLIGVKKVAQNHVYEINISSLQDKRRKVSFYDHCFSDTMDTNEIFRLAKCCVMPLNYLAGFMNQKTITFNLNIKKNQPASAKEPNTGANPKQSNPNNANNKKPANFGSKNQSDMPRGPKAPGRKQNKNQQS